MASETPRADAVFCQHLLKPVPNEPDTYRCNRCGQVGILVDQQIVWKAKKTDFLRSIVAAVRARNAVALVLAAVVTAAMVMTSTAATFGTRHSDAVETLQPIPLTEAVDDGCCGDDPQEARGICCVEYTYMWTDPRTGDQLGPFTVVDCELCEGGFQLCAIADLFQLANGHWTIKAGCLDMRRVIARRVI